MNSTEIKTTRMFLKPRLWNFSLHILDMTVF